MTSASSVGLPPSRAANAFGLLRLVMASAVIVSHAFPIGGFGADPTYRLFRGQADLGDLAVLGFFAISGFLITRSGASGSVRAFLWRRALRILPAFWVVLLVGALVVGPISYAASHDGLAGYWHLGAQGPAAYVLRNGALHSSDYGIDGVFVGSAYGQVHGVDAVNGSLWSLFFEFLCYLGVAAAMALGLLRSRARRALPALLAVGLVVIQLAPYVGVCARLVERVTIGSGGPELYLAFGCGAVAALFPERIRWSAPAATLAVGATAATLLADGFLGVGVVALSYAVLAAAHLAPSWACRIRAVTDVSYGVYIDAWPVAMLLQQFGIAGAGLLPFLAGTLFGTVALAAGSWFLVERPAMRWKSRGPGRPPGRTFSGRGAPARDKSPVGARDCTASRGARAGVTMTKVERPSPGPV